VRPANLARAKLPSAKPAKKPAATETAAAPAAPAPAAREVSSVSKGSRLVQLGAFDSEAITRQAWSRLVAKNPDLLGSKSLYVERATGSARVFYRLRVAGFQNTDQTRDMCEALRARGVDCIPVTLN
jgi:cell division septation protein DedD